MRIRLFCIAVICALFLTAQEPDALVTKHYVIGKVPILHDDMRSVGGGGGGGDPFGGLGGFGSVPSQESNLPWARKTANPKFLEEYVSHHTGVTFGEGAWIRYQRGGHVLHMHNTELNHELFELGLVRNGLMATQVEITLRLLAFDETTLDKIERKAPGPLTDADWVELWKTGEGKTLAVSTIKTLNGTNAIIECVEEIIYPTETDWSDSGIEVAKGGPPKLTKEPRLLYGGLETREVGAIVNVTPTVSADWNTLNLVLLPEIAANKGPNPDMPEVVKPTTPVFHSLNLTSSIVIQNGATLMAGQSTDAASSQRWVMLIHARLTTTRGKPVSTPILIPPPVEEEKEEEK